MVFKKVSQISVFLFAVIVSMTFGCTKPEETASVTPKIKYNGCDLIKYSDAANQIHYDLNLHIGFEDGDGDLGLESNDTLPPFNTDSKYYFNIFIEYYERINGQYTQLTNKYPFTFGDTINYNGRVPNLTPNSKHKGIQGDIAYKLEDVIPIAGDEIKFKIWIYDRALHKSNIVESPGIVLN
jgi:hypothetical protein